MQWQKLFLNAFKKKKSTNSISDKTDIIDKFMSSELEKYTEYIPSYTGNFHCFM